MSGIHAREWISPASVTYIIKELVENRSSNAWANNIEFNIVPVLNPDGYEFTHTKDRLWRKNRRNPELGDCSGTDLNRNFDYKWGGGGTSNNPCSEIYKGTSAFSEPESQALKNYLEIKNSTLKVTNNVTPQKNHKLAAFLFHILNIYKLQLKIYCPKYFIF